MIDFKKERVYKAQAEPEIVDIPQMLFVMTDGKGAPDVSSIAESDFQESMQIIYGIVYTIKFWDKKHQPPKGFDKFTMPPVEALWWMSDGSDFNLDKSELWRWTAIHRLPDFVTAAYFEEIVDAVCKQKGSEIFRKARLEKYHEGHAVQLMHIGPYDQETENIQRMHDFAESEGYQLHGRHHELYMNDPRRVAPDKVKVILRHPVKK
ncbi:MAG: GyrI-like domain-containing protein [Candidatus Saccharimonadales bacterium]|nr:GyrI-like domain-containing protein [Candidatus Saccharimonadales bacterium]